MLPQVKEHPETPKAGRGKERFSPYSLPRSMALLTP